MIIYGVLADVSIGKLFIGGILPGLLLAGAYFIYIIIVSKIRKNITHKTEKEYSLGEKIDYILKATFPFFVIMILIVEVITMFSEIALYLPRTMIK